MTLGKQLTDAIIANNGGNAPSATDGTLTVGADVRDRDRFSVSVDQIRVSGGAPTAGPAHEALVNRAAEATKRLGFLEEPLAVWELDAKEGRAQLRSNPPERDGEAVRYWEVELKAGERDEATIGRFEWSPGMPERESVPYPATHGTVARIADALAETLRAG